MNTESTSIDNQEEISPSNDSNESLPQENIPPTELQTNNNDEEQTDNPEENTEIYKSEDNKDEEAMKKLASEEGAVESSKESSQNDQHKQEVNDDDAYDDADADVDEHSQNYAIKPNEQPKKIIDPELYYNINEYIARPIITEDSGIPENLLNVYHQFGMDVSRRENLQLLKNNILCHIYGTQAVYSACQFSPDGEMIATVGSDPDYMLTLWEWRSEQIILRAKAFSQDIYRVAWSTDLYGVLTTAGVGHIRFWKMANTFTGLKLQGKLGKFGKVELSDIEGFVTLPDGKVLTGSAWGNLLVWEGELIKVQISRKGKRSCHNGHIMQIVVDEGELLTVGQDGWIRTWDFETIDTAECSEEGALYELEPMNELRVGTKSRLMHIIKIPIPDSTMWYAQDSDGEEFHANDIVDCVTSPFTYCAATVGLDGKVCIYDIVQKQVIVERRFPSSGSSLVWSPPQVDPKGKLLVVGHQDGVLRVLKFGKNPEELTRRTKSSALLDLGQALKPHKMAITSMIYSPSGKMFITGSKDETIFFFNVYPTHLSPIGFVHVHEKVVRLEWFYVNGKATNEIVVYLENGCVITVVCPSENEKYNHSKTFTLSDIQTTRSYQLMSIKSRLDHEEDAEIKLAKYEKEKEARQEIRRMNARLQPETDEEKQKLDDEEEAIRQGVMSEIADWAPTYPSHPSPLLYGCLDRNEPNNFWMSLGEFDKGYLYKCELGGPVLKVDETIEKLRKEKAELKKQNQIKHDIEDKNDAEQCDDKTESNDQESEEESVEVIDSNSLTLADRIIATEPTKAVRIPDTKDTCVTYWTFSNSGYRVLIGFNDGVIRVQLLEKPFDFTSFKGFWMFRLHDNQRGRINRIVLTYDEKFLLSAASDGTLFVCELMTEELQDKEIKEYRARIPSTFDTSKSVDDITDPKAYSIEESKQKSEYDRLLELAEQKKAETRRKLIELRRHFKKLKDKNERLPEKIRLPISEFNLVPEIRNDLFRDRKAEIDLVYRETAWETERNRLALEKLDTAFRKPLDFDRVTVKAFCSAHFVSSIRANKLSEEHLKANYEINKIRQQSLADEAMKQRFTQGDANVNVESEPEKVKSDTEQTQAPVKGARGLRVAQKLHVLEQARQRRAARRAQWEQLQSMKPADNYEDPKDVEAIRLLKSKWVIIN
ncbi:unnamed protein product [Heterobilharzia americana]|nr:unnamed protein product [Heterobilharzia americana]